MLGGGGTGIVPTYVFNQFAQTPLQAAAGGAPTGVGSGGIVQFENAPPTTGNQLITGQYAAQINPVTGQLEYLPVPAGYTPPSSGGIFSSLESAIGQTGTFILVALGLVAAIVIIPRVLPKR